MFRSVIGARSHDASPSFLTEPFHYLIVLHHKIERPLNQGSLNRSNQTHLQLAVRWFNDSLIPNVHHHCLPSI